MIIIINDDLNITLFIFYISYIFCKVNVLNIIKYIPPNKYGYNYNNHDFIRIVNELKINKSFNFFLTGTIYKNMS